MANFLANTFGAGAGSLVEAVGSAIDKHVTSDEEHMALEDELAKASMRHEMQMAKVKTHETEGADLDSAGTNQSRVHGSEHVSWLAKNIHAILAFSIISLILFVCWWIIFRDRSPTLINSGMKEATFYILGALATVASQVVSHFFGSGSSGTDKSKALTALAKKR